MKRKGLKKNIGEFKFLGKNFTTDLFYWRFILLPILINSPSESLQYKAIQKKFFSINCTKMRGISKTPSSSSVYINIFCFVLARIQLLSAMV